MSGNRRSTLQRVLKARWVYLAILPSIAFLLVFMIYPVIEAISLSFFDWKLTSYFNPRFIGLRNYEQILSDPLFWSSCRILLVFIAWGFCLTMGFVVPVTWLVYRLGSGWAGRLVQRAYVIPMMVPSMVLTLFWRFFYEPNFGMLNRILESAGKTEWTRVWLGEVETALPALLFMGFPWISGFGFLVILAGFQGIDESLHESGRIDGASSLRVFLRIDFPLIIPQLKILIILGMINGLQQFANPLIMTKGGPRYSTTVPGLLMYKNAFEYGKLGYGAAIGVLLFVVILAFSIVSNQSIKRAD